MKSTTKPCKICWKQMPKWLNNICSPKCKLEKEKQKKKQVKEQKKLSISSLSKVADKLWSECIRKIGKCEYCWKQDFLNAHHLIWRQAKNTRWELSNWICLCSWHHTFSSEFSAHKNPLLFHKWLEDYKGKEYIDKLMELSNIPLHVTSEYLIEKIRTLKLILSDES